MLFLSLAQAAGTFLLASQALHHVSAASITQRATVCNGNSELCSRSYGSVTFVGAHDSYAIGTDLASNQDQTITQQLNDGIRLLQVQAHQQSNSIELCHTSCFLKDGGSFAAYLKTVKTWVDAHPNEVLTILIVNSDNLPPTQWQAVYQSTGMDTVSFSPASASLTKDAWPTLGEMIDSGKRVVTFLDNQADFTQVPYIIDEFSNVWETPFDVTEASFPCSVNRTSSANPTSQLSLINHYLDTSVTVGTITFPAPDRDQLAVTNAASGLGSLGAEVQACIAAHGAAPNFLLVDFYEFGGGSVFQVAANINGVQLTSTSISSPVSTSGGSGTTSTPLGNMAFDSVFTARSMAAWATVVSSVLIGALWTF
ncbi:PLC-like phosphodiesterase [Hysterangium stoloniferum]|nr:PLC-like phosphodiesterase [Hysterangium stoloniferum]